MRTGEAFQGYRLVTRVAFDKTGTLTEGRPRIREIEAISGNTDELLVIAAAAEASSEHPLAQAVVEAAFEVRLQLPEADGFEALRAEECRVGNKGCSNVRSRGLR